MRDVPKFRLHIYVLLPRLQCLPSFLLFLLHNAASTRHIDIVTSEQGTAQRGPFYSFRGSTNSPFLSPENAAVQSLRHAVEDIPEQPRREHLQLRLCVAQERAGFPHGVHQRLGDRRTYDVALEALVL